MGMQPNRSKKSTLQMRLIKSIEDIIRDPREVEPHIQRLKKISTALDNANISEKDYVNVLTFSFMLVNEIPEILKHPRNNSLRKLANDCRLQCEESFKAQHRISANPRG
jgi:hypothetical protein